MKLNFFFHSYDTFFQSTARSSRVSTVYLTQNLPGIYSPAGGEGAKSEVDALFGNLQTKILHQNAENKTTDYASTTIGKTEVFKPNFNNSSGNDKQGSSSSIGMSSRLDFQVKPMEFTTLKKGGEDNNCIVEAIIFQGGRIWNDSGKNYLFARFKQ